MLLSRSPLASLRRGVPFDLHVLGAPPAFILSQDLEFSRPITTAGPQARLRSRSRRGLPVPTQLLAGSDFHFHASRSVL